MRKRDVISNLNQTLAQDQAVKSLRSALLSPPLPALESLEESEDALQWACGFRELSQPLAASGGAAGRAGGHCRASHRHRVQGSVEIPLLRQKQFKVANGRFPQTHTTAFLRNL